MFRAINYGCIQCDDGVTIRVSRERISYMVGRWGVAVPIERLSDSTVIIYAASTQVQNPDAADYDGPGMKAVVERICEALEFMGQAYVVEGRV